MTYTNYETGKIISQAEWLALPSIRRMDYHTTYDHDESNPVIDESDTVKNDPVEAITWNSIAGLDTDFNGFGGGSGGGGGGGATGNF